MDPIVIGILGLLLLFVLFALGLQVGIAMIVISFIGIWYFAGDAAAMVKLATVPFRQVSNYDMTVLPLFLLMAQICATSGIVKDLYNLASKWLGRLPGGLAMATVGACAGFAAVSSSSLATAATMGAVAIPEMKKYHYRPELSTGCVAAGGTLGILIPPSFMFILYGIMTETSIKDLFVGGIVPGVLSAVFYIITIFILCKLKPDYGPPGPSSTLREKLAAFKPCGAIVFLAVLVLGGLMAGWFTPSEAGAVGAFGAIVISLFGRRLTWKGFCEGGIELMKTTGTIYTVLIGAMIITPFMAMSTIPNRLAEYVAGLPLPPLAIVGVILLVYIILGCFMDTPAMTALTIPIFFPVIVSLGFNPIWFGILVTRMMEIGMVTPPVGINVYVIAGVIKDVPMQTVFKGIIPFFLADICHVLLIFFFPVFVLWLPGLL